MSGSGATAEPRLRGIRDFLFDLDGCIWFGSELAPAARELVADLREAGRGVYFVTNASGAEPDALAAKLSRLGIPTGAEHVIAPLAVVTRHPAFRDRSRALVVGKEQVGRALASQGVEVVTDPDRAQVVVVGNDSRFGYADLTAGMRAVDQGAVLLALNMDRRLPTAGGGFVPGTGAIVAALEAATGVQAELVGKPTAFFFRAALDAFGLDASDTAMVGDTPESDVAGGRDAGLFTVLIGPADPPEELAPDLRYPDLRAFHDAVGAERDEREPTSRGGG